MKVKITITDSEFDAAAKVAFEKLYASEDCSPWFDTKEQAEEWAGDVAFEFVVNTLEALGIELVEDEDE